ncbi:MAG: DUF6011 domain-containing protein [Methanobacteriota archaeon]
MKCRRCHRKIKNPKSVQQGYGPVCRAKMQKSNDNGETDKPQIWTTAHGNMNKKFAVIIIDTQKDKHDNFVPCIHLGIMLDGISG